MLDGFETLMIAGAGQATLTVYQTDISLAVFNLGASGSGVPFGSAVSDSIALSSTLSAPISNTGTAVAGTANRFIVANQGLATMLAGTISAVGGGGDIQVPSTTVTAVATSCRLNSFVIRVSATGVLTVEASLTLV